MFIIILAFLNLIKSYLNIFSIQIINPLQRWELLSKSKKYKNSIDLSSQTISLPCYPSLKKKELIRIEQVIDRVSSLL